MTTEDTAFKSADELIKSGIYYNRIFVASDSKLLSYSSSKFSRREQWTNVNSLIAQYFPEKDDETLQSEALGVLTIYGKNCVELLEDTKKFDWNEMRKVSETN